MATFERRKSSDGSTSIRVKIRLKGHPAVTGSFTRMTDAREWAVRTEAKLREARAFGASRATLGDAIECYRSEELPRLADSERRNRERHLGWWSARRGPVLLREMGKSAVREDLRKLREVGMRGRPVKVATANRYKAALSAVLSYAVDREWIESNPLHSASRRRKANTEREEERERILSLEEWARLKGKLRISSDSRLYALSVCALASGARQGELMGMLRSRLELFPQDYEPATGGTRPGVPRYLLEDSKNGESRMLYFPGEAAETLRAIASRPTFSRYLWALAGDLPEELPAFPADAFRYAKKAACIRNFRFHDLRHMWAIHLLDSGASLPQLMILGGWKSAVMVRRYAKGAQRHGGSHVDALAQRLPR